jgi:hypothetical protein
VFYNELKGYVVDWRGRYWIGEIKVRVGRSVLDWGEESSEFFKKSNWGGPN